MIKLTVQTYNGSPLPQALSAQFDELGGSIGRADTNQLVLPDPERSISRVHAQVVFRNGGYAIVDRGSNPVLLNGRSLGNGTEAALSAGDQLQIGGYAIRVDVLGPAAGLAPAGGASAVDPFADLGGMAFGAPAAAPAPRPGAGGASLDPLAAFGTGAAPTADPFGFVGGFGGPSGASPSAAPMGGFGGAAPAATPAQGAQPASGGIPDDWDPFAPEPASAPKPQDLARSLGQGNSLGLDLGAAGPAPLIPDMADLGGGKANTISSIDAMFGLGAGGGGDPLANSVFAQAAAQPNMANHVDPMRSLNSVNAASATAAPDQVSALSQPFLEAPLTAPGPRHGPSVPAAPSSSTAASWPPVPGGPAGPGKGAAVMSWDDGAQESRTVIRPKSPGSVAGTAPRLGDFDSWGTTASTPAMPVAASAMQGNGPAGSTAGPVARAPDAGLLDPLALLGGGSAPVSDPLHLADPLDGPKVTPPTPVGADIPGPHPHPHSMLGGTATGAVGPGATPAGPARAGLPGDATIPAPPPVHVPPSAMPSAGVAAAPSAVVADQAALVAALREGLGLPALPLQSLTPEFMKLLGQLVHEATRGTVDLLVARAALKREIRAEVTMIVAKENNPLKFSPSVDVALGHLLSPPARGFMPPAPAMRDAYDDLRAHQFAFVAGMRAALEGVLQRFDPAVLEGKLTQKSVLSTLLPASRKARMWDVFTELYGQISAEASDDFHELFGKEFLRAYEAHIDQLQQDS